MKPFISFSVMFLFESLQFQKFFIQSFLIFIEFGFINNCFNGFFRGSFFLFESVFSTHEIIEFFIQGIFFRRDVQIIHILVSFSLGGFGSFSGFFRGSFESIFSIHKNHEFFVQGIFFGRDIQIGHTLVSFGFGSFSGFNGFFGGGLESCHCRELVFKIVIGDRVSFIGFGLLGLSMDSFSMRFVHHALINEIRVIFTELSVLSLFKSIHVHQVIELFIEFLFFRRDIQISHRIHFRGSAGSFGSFFSFGFGGFNFFEFR